MLFRSLDLSVLPHHESATDVPLEQFRKTLEVNVLGTFLTARTWLRALREHRDGHQSSMLRNVSLILIGSASGHWGNRGNPDYGTSKAAVQYGLLSSLLQDVPRVYPGARVNAVAPGSVNTVASVASPLASPEPKRIVTAAARPRLVRVGSRRGAGAAGATVTHERSRESTATPPRPARERFGNSRPST